MVKDNQIHSALLTQAAKTFLRPLGLFQKGRSRIWLSDQIWWSVAVEFQPSGFSRGSFLNVGCMWLWNVKSYISFDLGHRVEEFHGFEDENQFKGVANKLANLAANRVLHYRAQFSTVWELSDYYIKNPPVQGWPSFNAGIAHALSERPVEAAQILFAAFRHDDREVEYVKKAKRDIAMLLEILPDSERFESHIINRIQETRKLIKLPEVNLVHID